MKVVIVFYHARRGLPLREANASHLRCWQRYSKYRTVYVNVAFPVPWSLLQRLDIVAVIFDTIFLSMHWSPDYFVEHAYKCDPVKQLRCPKIGVVQDEFTNMKCVVKFLADVEITHLLTASTAADWPTIYNGLDFDRVQFRTVLTGYVDEKRLKKVKRKRLAGRKIDIGYRAWANPYWLGEHGLKKVQIAEQVAAAARNRSLVLDISNPEATRFLIGDDWFGFLQDCKVVLEVEGGSSVFDRDGSVRRRVEAYLEDHPSASFEETRRQCFASEEGSLRELKALSPRHLEAAMTGTCQILLEGNYNGVLTPWRHYVPLKSDYSNLDEVLGVVGDVARMQAIADCAYEEVVASQAWSYRQFVGEIERGIIDSSVSQSASFRSGLAPYLLLLACDRLFWMFAHFKSSTIGKRLSAATQRYRRIAFGVMFHLRHAWLGLSQPSVRS